MKTASHEFINLKAGVERVAHPLERVGVVQPCAPLFDLHPSFGRQKFKDKKQRTGAAPLVFVVKAKRRF